MRAANCEINVAGQDQASTTHRVSRCWVPRRCAPQHCSTCLLQHRGVAAGRPRLQLLQLQRRQVKPRLPQLLRGCNAGQLLARGGRAGQQRKALLGLPAGGAREQQAARCGGHAGSQKECMQGMQGGRMPAPPIPAPCC